MAQHWVSLGQAVRFVSTADGGQVAETINLAIHCGGGLRALLILLERFMVAGLASPLPRLSRFSPVLPEVPQ